MTHVPTNGDAAPAYLPIRTRLHHHVLELALDRHLKNTQAAKGTVSATGASTHDLAIVEQVCQELKRDVAGQLDAFGPAARPVEATPIEAAIADTDRQLQSLAAQMLSAGILIAPGSDLWGPFVPDVVPERGDEVQGELRRRKIAHVFGYRVPDVACGSDATTAGMVSALRALCTATESDFPPGAFEIDFVGADPAHYLCAWNEDFSNADTTRGAWVLASPDAVPVPAPAADVAGKALVAAIVDGDPINSLKTFVERGRNAQAAVDTEVARATSSEPPAPLQEQLRDAVKAANKRGKRGGASPKVDSAERYAARIGDKPAEHAPRSAKGKRRR